MALAQCLAGRDRREIVAEAKAAGADIILFPEMYSNYPAPRCDGHAFAVDPSGRIIVMADASPGLVFATFDLAAIRKARREDRFRWQI